MYQFQVQKSRASLGKGEGGGSHGVIKFVICLFSSDNKKLKSNFVRSRKGIVLGRRCGLFTFNFRSQ